MSPCRPDTAGKHTSAMSSAAFRVNTTYYLWLHGVNQRFLTYFLVKYGIHIQLSVKHSTLTSSLARSRCIHRCAERRQSQAAPSSDQAPHCLHTKVPRHIYACLQTLSLWSLAMWDMQSNVTAIHGNPDPLNWFVLPFTTRGRVTDLFCLQNVYFDKNIQLSEKNVFYFVNIIKGAYWIDVNKCRYFNEASARVLITSGTVS